MIQIWSKIFVLYLIINFTLASTKEPVCNCPSKAQSPKIHTPQQGFQFCGSELQRLSATQNCISEDVYVCYGFDIPGYNMRGCFGRICGRNIEYEGGCKKTGDPEKCYMAHTARSCNKQPTL